MSAIHCVISCYDVLFWFKQHFFSQPFNQMRQLILEASMLPFINVINILVNGKCIRLLAMGVTKKKQRKMNKLQRAALTEKDRNKVRVHQRNTQIKCPHGQAIFFCNWSKINSQRLFVAHFNGIHKIKYDDFQNEHEAWEREIHTEFTNFNFSPSVTLTAHFKCFICISLLGVLCTLWTSLYVLQLNLLMVLRASNNSVQIENIQIVDVCDAVWSAWWLNNNHRYLKSNKENDRSNTNVPHWTIIKNHT